MKVTCLVVVSLFSLIVIISCSNKDFVVSAIKTATSNFESNSDTIWTGGVAGYPATVSLDNIRFSAVINTLPTGLDTTEYALHVYSRNLTGAMFTYVKRKLGGLAKNTSYEVAYEIDLATNYPENIPAGNAVFLKAGASSVEPGADASRTFNLDKGDGASGGNQMVLLGNVSNELSRATYVNTRKTSSGKPIVVQSDEHGDIWLCVGIESLYAGATDLYFHRITATINQL
jgi:hypothetical protein